ncbi:hypothetical protein Cadr_000006659 [Camelus dromedarius]|uniref:Uncharacterized protein n=1 Tax=Camelus dromedarius TaxID=9838 RepID=A0A5N4E5W8_CAMDR|nr:hypothetical protein Cadr_000006659 [Camelus dromedarius]
MGKPENPSTEVSVIHMKELEVDPERYGELLMDDRVMGCILEKATEGVLSPGRNAMTASTTVTKTWSRFWNYEEDLSVKLMRYRRNRHAMH